MITKSNLKTKKQEEETKNVTVKATKENSWSRLKLIFFLVKLLRQIKTFVSHLAKLFTQMSLYIQYLFVEIKPRTDQPDQFPHELDFLLDHLLHQCI